MSKAAEDGPMRVLLFGLGAIGGFYAFILGRNKSIHLSVVARSNYDAVKQKVGSNASSEVQCLALTSALGLRIESDNHGTHTARIDEVLRTPSEATQPFSYIVCTNKAVNLSTIPPLFRSVVNDDTTFVILQNGVGNEEPFRNAYPNNTIISGVVWVGGKQLQPGVIHHTASEMTQFGLYPNPRIDSTRERQRLEGFAELFRQGGTGVEVVEDIQTKRWEKVIWNCAWNSLTTLTSVNTQVWLYSTPEAVATTKRLMREVIDVARKCGVPVDYSLVDKQFELILGMPGIFASMHTDVMEGRPLEVDVIQGYPMKKAREMGMDVPVLTAMYALIMAINGRIVRSLEEKERKGV